MKKCLNCGAESRDQAKFCTSCGTPFPVEAAEQAPESVIEKVAAPVVQAPEAPVPPMYEPAPVEEEVQPPVVEAPAPPVYAEQPPVVEAPAPYAYAEQPPVAEEPAPPTYGYAPAEQPAPPTYGYAPPAQQPQQPAAPPPPPYGYEPQAQQSTAPPTYGYAQQPPSPQAAPAYGYPPQAPEAPKPKKPKKKRRWLIPVIAISVVIALLVGAYFIFADQIKGLFGSPEKKWLDAEKSLLTADEDSLFGLVQKSLDKQLSQKKFGGEAAISIDVEGIDDPDAAAIFDIVRKLRLTVGFKAETDTDDLRFHTKIGLGNREKEGDALTLQIYSVDGNFVVDASPILQNPLVLRAEALQEMMDVDDDFSVLFAQENTKFANAMKNIAKIMSSPEKIGGDLLDIVAKHAEKPEVEKGAEVTVSGISQKFDKYTVIVKAEKTPEMFKDILTYIRDNEDIRKVIEELAAISEILDPPMPGKVYSNAFTYEDFVAELNDAIEDIEKNPDNYRGEFDRVLYLDKKGNPQGGKLTIWNVDDGDKEKVFTIEDAHVESDGKHAYKLFVQAEDDEALIFTSQYTLKDKLYTGDFDCKMSNDGNETTLFTGSVADFGFAEADGQVYPVGKLALDLDNLSGGTFSDSPGVKIIYDGKIEKKSDGSHLLATIEFGISDADIGLSAIKLTLDLKSLPEKDITFETKMPTDFVDLTDEEALEALVANDPGIMFRAMSVLSELGIDISQFMFD